jgi:allantoin racemase
LQKTSHKLRSRGAEVLVLGCAGLTGFVEDLQKRVAMPVIDPVEAGCRMLKSVCETGLNTSHIGLYSKPAQQNMQRPERLFSPYLTEILRKLRK